MKIINTQWYTVKQPWGDGDFIRAGNPDCAGEFVCDCVIPTSGDVEREESAQEIAEHIVRSHNWVLDLAQKQVPLDFLIEACERVTERKTLLSVTLGVIGDSEASVADEQLKLIQQSVALLKQAASLEEKDNVQL